MRTCLAFGALVLTGVVAYHNSFSGPFTFDDIPGIRDNATIRALWPVDSALSPPANSGLGGRPLANLSLALNHAIAGIDVRGYHVGNLLLHLASTLLLFGIVRRTLCLAGVSKLETGDRQPESSPFAASVSGFRSPVSGFDIAALAAAAMWSAHPLTTASVTYLSQRTELLMAFFYLLTIYAFIRGVLGSEQFLPEDAVDAKKGTNAVASPLRALHPPVKSRGWLLISVIACALGMMSKEVMLTAPLLVLMFDRTFVAGSFRGAWRVRWRYYLGLGATWIVLGALLTTGLAQRSVGFGLGVSPGEYALTECRAILIYLRLAAWPASLIFDYGAIYSSSLLAVLGLLLLVGLAVVAFVRRSTIGFLAAAFFVLLAPTSTFVPVAEQPVAENRMYLPLAALVVLGILAVAKVTRERVAAAVAATAALAMLTVARNTDYHSELALWTDTVVKRPENARANFNLGVVLLDLGRAAEAAGYFERAIKLKPREPKAHNSLGNALLELGRVPEAVRCFAEAVRLQPDYARAWSNYGTALMRQGDASGALERFERSIRLDGSNAEAHSGMGNAYFQLGRPAEAIPHYAAALAIDPTLADAHYNAGSASLELGRLEDAVKHFSAAAKLKPDDPEVRNNLGAALLRNGRVTDAIEELAHALRLKPDYADAKSNLEVARQEQQRKK